MKNTLTKSDGGKTDQTRVCSATLLSCCDSDTASKTFWSQCIALYM